MKILISTSSFAQFDDSPLKLLRENNIQYELNPYGRTLTKPEVNQLLEGKIGIVAGTEILDKEIMERFSDLRVISRVGVGMDSVDLQTAAAQNIKVFCTPDGPTQAVAELTLGLILNLMRQISAQDRMIRNQRWKKVMGSLLQGKKIGILGLGKIGKRVATLAKAFGCSVVAYDVKPDIKWCEDNGVLSLKLTDLLASSDIVTIHLPLLESTRNLINHTALSRMKSSALLVQVSRGGIVDESAVCDALKAKKLAGAAFDVFDSEPYVGPLTEFDNVILSPHIGSYARESRIEMEIEAVTHLINALIKDGKVSKNSGVVSEKVV